MKNLSCLLLVLITMSCRNENNNQPAAETPSEKQKVAVFDPVKVAAKDYRIDDQHSYIGFKIRYFGFSPVRGRFDTFNGYVFYDPQAVESTQMTLFIDVNSINTGNERRDNDLITETAWFNETAHPKITFHSKSVAQNEDGSFDLIGDFNMNGVQKELVIPFDKPTKISRDFAANEQVDFSARLVINRKDFGVNGGDFWDTVLEDGLTQLSDEVEIELDIHTRRPDYIKRYVDLEPGNVRKIVLDAFEVNGNQAGMDSLHRRARLLTTDSPLTSGAWSTIGNTLIARNKLEDAMDVFKKASEEFPDRTSLTMDMGVVLLLQNKNEDAKNLFKKILEADPYHARAKAYIHLLESWNER